MFSNEKHLIIYILEHLYFDFVQSDRIGADEEIDDTAGMTVEEIEEMRKEKEAKARATILEIVGDIPDADMAPPENVLFVCKLNPVTNDDDLVIIFSRFGKIVGCEVIRDRQSGDSLQYAFIEFAERKSCEEAYFKMDNVLIDDRRIHVDFSQSVAKMRWRGKGKGIKYYDDDGKEQKKEKSRNDDKRNRSPKEERNKYEDRRRQEEKKNGDDRKSNRRRERSRSREIKDRREKSRSNERKIRNRKERSRSRSRRDRSKEKNRERRERSRSRDKIKDRRDKKEREDRKNDRRRRDFSEEKHYKRSWDNKRQRKSRERSEERHSYKRKHKY